MRITHGARSPAAARPVQKLLAPLGLGGVELVRHAVACQHAPQLVHPGLRGTAHHGDLAGQRGACAGPLVQELRDDLVEVLVGHPPRLGDVVVDLAPAHGRHDRLGSRPVAPGPPIDQQRPGGVRVDVPRATEQLDAGEARRPQVREHERHRHAVVTKPAQDLERLGAGAVAEHLVVRGIAAPQVLLHDGERGRIVVHRHDHGLTVTHLRVLSEGPADDIRVGCGARFGAAIEARSLSAVGVAQLVELLVVVQAVAGSSPVAHP